MYIINILAHAMSIILFTVKAQAICVRKSTGKRDHLSHI